MKRYAKILKETGGMEIAEAALILPLLFMLIFGILWFGHAFYIYATVNRAARAAALAAATPSCATCGNTYPSQVYVQNNVLNPILTSASLDTGQVKNFTVIPVTLNPISSPQETGVKVSFNYHLSFPLRGVTCCPFTLTPIASGLNIHASAQARKEQ